MGVQHHHAHVASCLVDHQRDGRVLGVAFDGHGYGTDGTLWGGEFLVADYDTSERVGHLLAVPLLGGSAAIREPWRMAAAWIRQAGGAELAETVVSRLDPRAAALLRIEDAIATTSMGRLFDAAAAIVVGRTRASYEGQAAIELEALARPVPAGEAATVAMVERRTDGRLVLDPSPLLLALLDMAPGPDAAAVFHESVGRATVDAAIALAHERGLGTVVLTGGVFQNARLTGIVSRGLTSAGLEVLVHRDVPPNDGGISIGQAAIAAHRAG
jgi:hydrogenase maturation protein HypF